MALSDVSGIDVSQYQGTPDWAAVKAAAIGGAPLSLAYIRSTYGPSTEDPEFARNWAGAAGAELVHGAYHFALPSGSSASTLAASAQRQAAYFLDVVDRQGGITAADMPPVLDLEVTGAPGGAALDGAQLAAWAAHWLADVNAAAGLAAGSALLYTYLSFWQTYLAPNASVLGTGVRLWIADYGGTPPVAHVGHQYTNRLIVAGIVGAVDGDRFDAALLPAASKPAAPVVTWTVSATRLDWHFTPPTAAGYRGWAQSVGHPATAPAFQTSGGYFRKAWGPVSGGTLYLTFFFSDGSASTSHALSWPVAHQHSTGGGGAGGSGSPSGSGGGNSSGSSSGSGHGCFLDTALLPRLTGSPAFGGGRPADEFPVKGGVNA